MSRDEWEWLGGRSNHQTTRRATSQREALQLFAAPKRSDPRATKLKVRRYSRKKSARGGRRVNGVGSKPIPVTERVGRVPNGPLRYRTLPRSTSECVQA